MFYQVTPCTQKVPQIHTPMQQTSWSLAWDLPGHEWHQGHPKAFPMLKQTHVLKGIAYWRNLAPKLFLIKEVHFLFNITLNKLPSTTVRI